MKQNILGTFEAGEQVSQNAYIPTQLIEEVDYDNDQFGLILTLLEHPAQLERVLEEVTPDYKPKKEFHITVLGRNMREYIAEQCLKAGLKIPGKEEFTVFSAMATQLDWTCTALPDEEVSLYQIGKRDNSQPSGFRYAIIQEVQLPALADFYIQIYSYLGFPADRIPGVSDSHDLKTLLKLPFAHVTLAHTGTKGIGVDSELDFRSYGPVPFE